MDTLITYRDFFISTLISLGFLCVLDAKCPSQDFTLWMVYMSLVNVETHDVVLGIYPDICTGLGRLHSG